MLSTNYLRLVSLTTVRKEKPFLYIFIDNGQTQKLCNKYSVLNNGDDGRKNLGIVLLW